MGRIQYANAKTTPRIRQEIQDSDETIAVLAKRLSLNDVFIALIDNIPALTRSNLHRCLVGTA